MNYWELRRWLFGERAFLPMTQTGSGALNDHDIQLLQQVPITLLHHDEMGRIVLYFEETRKDVDPTLFDRISFVS